jgi:hypothetical protein
LHRRTACTDYGSGGDHRARRDEAGGQSSRKSRGESGARGVAGCKSVTRG